jgi:signal peptidase II
MFYKYKKSVSLIYSLILAILLIVLDQFTKVLAVSHLMNKADIILIPGVLQLHYLENTGAAFSILEGKQVVFAIITPILLVALCYILVKMPQVKKYQALDYIIVFLVAGAIGNYIDRIMNNYVVDFIYFSLINFPVFNVADCYVTVSVILLLILIMWYYTDEDLDDIKKGLKITKNG